MALKVRDILRGLANKCKDLDAPLYVETPEGVLVGVIGLRNDEDGDLVLEIPEDY